MFIQLYQNDVNTFGAPENSGLKTAPALAHQKTIDICATDVATPSKVIRQWESRLKDHNDGTDRLNGNGKRRRIDSEVQDEEEEEVSGATGGSGGSSDA
ncbi:hypothetical protein K435DRAFT_112634 [Dendrothele bispora CBS 962.96]|nr:hypothetical protein K435DRAFT_112634 [Dendrothele bispora CBS 962.96]